MKRQQHPNRLSSRIAFVWPRYEQQRVHLRHNRAYRGRLRVSTGHAGGFLRISLALLIATTLAHTLQAQDDRTELEGAWVRLSAVERGTRLEVERYDVLWRFESDRFLWRWRGREQDLGTFSLDHHARHNTINIDRTFGQTLGIYRLNGDELTVSTGDTRPTTFESTEENLVTVRVFNRVPSEHPPDLHNEKTELEGTWKLVTLVVAGKVIDCDFPWRFEGRNLIRRANGYKYQEEVERFNVDPLATTPQIDLESEEGHLMGIYELDGDLLTICLGQSRPGKFESTEDSRTLLWVLRRHVE